MVRGATGANGREPIMHQQLSDLVIARLRESITSDRKSVV